MTITVHIDAALPVAALAEFLQLLRAWDAGRDDRHLNIRVTALELSAEQLDAILATLDPPLPFRIDIPRPAGEG